MCEGDVARVEAAFGDVADRFEVQAGGRPVVATMGGGDDSFLTLTAPELLPDPLPPAPSPVPVPAPGTPQIASAARELSQASSASWPSQLMLNMGAGDDLGQVK